MKRIAIYCFYSQKGKMCIETLKQIQGLREIVDYLIIVVNGEINNQDGLNFADMVIRRPNLGLDAGAYKDVLTRSEIRKCVQTYDQLVLCNSTFFGPFEGFKSIFRKMDMRKLDFWGMSDYDNLFLRHIQSYFLVFNKRILQDEDFWEYWDNKINSLWTEFYKVCYWFENGLFNKLALKYSYGAYVEKLGVDIYQNSDKCLYLGLPILKKKIFKRKPIDKTNILCSLKMIKEKYNYEIDYILEEIKEEYDINITKTEINNFLIPSNLKIHKYPVCKKTIREIQAFAHKKKDIYIYGTGNYAYYVYQEIFTCCNIKGFIVSDQEHRTTPNFCGHKVFILNEIKNVNIIIGLSYDNTLKVIDLLKNNENILNLWM